MYLQPRLIAGADIYRASPAVFGGDFAWSKIFRIACISKKRDYNEEYGSVRASAHYNDKKVFTVVMLSARETAEKWGVSLRYVQTLCKNGRVPGAEHKGKYWLIPADADRPADGRSKTGKEAEVAAVHRRPLLRKSPFLIMTDLYHTPGGADQAAQNLTKHPEAQALLRAETAYSRGQIDQVYSYARYFLDSHSGMYAVIAGSMLLSLAAVWKGDIHLWNEAHRHIYEAPIKHELDQDIISLSIAAMDSEIRNTKDFPDWFARGCFDNLPRDSHPAARVYYIKHLMILAQDVAMGHVKLNDWKGTSVLKMLPYIMEPMISQMVVDKVVMAEIYLRLLCAIAYRQSGDDVRANEHLVKAIRLCLADGFYAPLVEYRRQLGLFLDDRLALIDPEALKTVKAMHKQYHAGWTKLHNAVLERSVHVHLTAREREVARLAAFGMSNQAIGSQLSLSVHTVNSLLNSAKNKIGVESRAELREYI